mmetsp:Transcript_3326/g.10199  ORF Transcript_3326/g.10199 Transcript_3326/m.10199 type:complete len:104 (+) Transcript_3326:105-416(+)
MATRRARAETTTSDLRAVNTFLLTYDSSSAKGLLSQLRVSLVSGELDEDLLERRLADAVVLDKAALFSSLHELQGRGTDRVPWRRSPMAREENEESGRGQQVL